MINYNTAFRAALMPKIRGMGDARVIVKKPSGTWLADLRGTHIKSVEFNTQVDPLCRSLPTETLTVEVYDLDGDLNPGDPDSKFGRLTGKETVELSIRIQDENGVWRYGHSGDGWDAAIPLKYHLTGGASYDGTVVKLSAVRLLSSLTKTFTGLYDTSGDVTTNTLKDVMLTSSSSGSDHGLQTNVEAAGGSIVYDDFRSFAINDANYIGTTELRDALLQVGVASGTMLYTNENDVIRLTKYHNTHPSVVTSDDQLSRPTLESTPALQDEIVVARSVGEQPETPERITVGTVEGVYPAGETTILVEFSAPVKSGTLQHQDTNCTVRPISYTSSSAWVRFTPTDPTQEIKVELTAEEIPVKSIRYVHHVNDSGNDEELRCDLVSPKTAPTIAGIRANYITTMTETYRIKYRGDPSIFVNDIIRISIGGQVRTCLVIGTKFSIGTSFSGELTVKPYPIGTLHPYSHIAIAGEAIAGDAICGNDRPEVV